MHIQVLYDRPGFVVCVKQPGMISESEGLLTLLCEQEKWPVLYPVHRLDRGTGGVALLAKTPASCSCLSGMFSGGTAEKEYLAVVRADSPGVSGSFRDLLYYDRRKNKSYVVKSLRKGVREAFCTWEFLSSAEIGEHRFHLVKVRIHTGRTHLIRVQFASRGMPLYGDVRYGSEAKAPNPALWASGLSFPDPEKPDRILSFRSDPPCVDPWNVFGF